MRRLTFPFWPRPLIGALVVVAGVAVLSGCGGSSAASPSKVAGAAGASSCDNSGFYLQSKISSDKSEIYDCRFSTKLPKCVTYSGNIASDATSEVQLLFQTALNAQRPACLTWLKAAQARQARVAALRAKARAAAKLHAYVAALTKAQKEPWHQGYAAYVADIQLYQLPNVYYKFLPQGSYSCADYVTDGCWKAEVVTRNGCSIGLSIELGEMLGGTQIGTAYGSGGSPSPETPVIIEIDADTSQSVTGHVDSITCG